MATYIAGYFCTVQCTKIFVNPRKFRAGGIGPAAPALAAPVFSQGKSKIPFLQKASNKQSANMILGLIKVIILTTIDRRDISSGARLSAAHAFRLLICSQGTLLCKSYIMNRVEYDFLTF